MILWIIVGILWTILVVILGYWAGKDDKSSKDYYDTLIGPKGDPGPPGIQGEPGPPGEPAEPCTFNAEMERRLFILWENSQIMDDDTGLTSRMTGIENRMTRLERKAGFNV